MANWGKKQARKRLEKRLKEIMGMSDSERARLFRKAEIRQLWWASRSDLIKEKLYTMSREEMEDLIDDLCWDSPIYENVEDDPEFDLIVLINEVLIQTDPSLTQEDIDRLNDAARKFFEAASGQESTLS